MGDSGETVAVVDREEWLQARQDLLQREKALTREMDALAALRRRLPRVRLEADYRFQTPDGECDLADLFAGHRQLIVYHFMFAPDWQEGCRGCSFLADHLDGANLHLAHHDVSLVAVSRAPLERLLAFRQRMGWQFPWVSSAGSRFNEDFAVHAGAESVQAGSATYNYRRCDQPYDEMPGLSVFLRDAGGALYHTYSTYARGLDILLGAHNLLDLTPYGRNERSTMDWVRLHDRYDTAASVACCH